MKVIKKGNLAKAQWWKGLTFECPSCGQIVLLEADEPDRIAWVRHDARSATVACELCQAHTTIPNSEANT